MQTNQSHRSFSSSQQQVAGTWPSRPMSGLDGLSTGHAMQVTSNPEMLGSYPITDEHGSIYYQLLSFKLSNPSSPAPVILNLDPHHDFYDIPDFSTIAVLSGTWARPVVQMGLARVYTVLPCIDKGNQGGLGEHTWSPPQVVRDPALMDWIDYSSAVACPLPANSTCELKDLQVHAPVSDATIPGSLEASLAHAPPAESSAADIATQSLSRYNGPVWLSIDYDFFSLRDNYHHTGRRVRHQLKQLTDYLAKHAIQPTEVLGYRSCDYLSLGSGSKRADSWIASVDGEIQKLRAACIARN